MINYIKNLFAELSVFDAYRRAKDDITSNPILAWWIDTGCDPDKMYIPFKSTPSVSDPVSTEELFVAMDIILSTEPVNKKSKLNKNNLLRLARFNFYLYRLSYPFVFIINTLMLCVLYTTPNLLLPIGVTATMAFSLACIALPGMVPLNVATRIKTTRLRISPISILVIIGFLLFPALVAIFFKVFEQFLIHGQAQIVITLIVVNFLSMLIGLVVALYSIRHTKHLIDKRRMET